MLTQALWPSRLSRKTGRSGTIRSSSSRRGVPPSKAAMYQPPPRIHGSSGWSRGVGGDDLEVVGRDQRDVQVAAQQLHAADRPGGRARPGSPGVTVRPRSSMTRVRGPIERTHAGVRPDRDDPAVADGERGRPARGPRPWWRPGRRSGRGRRAHRRSWSLRAAGERGRCQSRIGSPGVRTRIARAATGRGGHPPPASIRR